VLVTGGVYINNTDQSSAVASCELYNPTTGTWSATGSMNDPRAHHTASVLPNGTVLVTGGAGVSSLSSSETYNTRTGSWSRTGSMSSVRLLHTATVLSNGKVLAAGGLVGWSASGPVAVSSAELYPAKSTEDKSH